MDISSIVTNAIGALIAAAVIGLSKAIWESRRMLIGIVTTNVATIRDICLAALRNIAVMWFLLYQIQVNVSSDEPVTRGSILLISFWVWWALFYLAAMLGFIVKPRDPPKKT